MKLISQKEFYSKSNTDRRRLNQLIRGYYQYKNKKRVRFQMPILKEGVDYVFVSGNLFLNKNSEMIKKRLDKSS